MENKVIITYYDVNKNLAEEKLWIEKIHDGNYKIKNIPFFAPNLAYDDIISIEEDEGRLYFEDLIQPSGHSTIQIVVLNTEKTNEIIENIEKFGCFWEGMDNQSYLAVNILSSINYTGIKQYLESMLDNNFLDYKEACLSDPHLENINFN